MSIYNDIAEKLEGRSASYEDEMELLGEAVKDSDVHVEVVCLWGATAIYAALSGAKQVYSIDCMKGGWWDDVDPYLKKRPTPEIVAANIEKFGLTDRVHLIRAYSEPWPLVNIKPDTIFIDGDHSYGGVKVDWNNAKKLAKRAVIFHDYDSKGNDFPGIKKLIQESVLTDPGWKLVKHVNHLVVFERVEYPMVSIVLPTRNRPELLRRALASIEEQTFDDYEVIVINDGGEDVRDIVAQFAKTSYITHDKNKGASAARNTGLKAAKGHYIAYLDDDDWYYPKHLAILVDYLQRLNKTSAHTLTHGVYLKAGERQLYVHHDYSPRTLLTKTLVHMGSVMHERALVDKVGYFDESLKIIDDWDFLIRLAMASDFDKINEVTRVVDRTRVTLISDTEAAAAEYEQVKSRYSTVERRVKETAKVKTNGRVKKPVPIVKKISNPMVSIILPTYNRPKLLERALHSIERQTYKEYEVIVVNDGGVDVGDIVAKFSKTVYIQHETNKGLAAARNTALNAAQGEYITYLDDDDLYYKRHLGALVSAIKRKRARLVYSDFEYWYEDTGKKREVRLGEWSREKYQSNSTIPVSSILHERGLIDQCGMFDEELENHEDYDLWLRFSEVCDFVHVPFTTNTYTRRGNNSQLSSDYKKMVAGKKIVMDKFKARHGV